MGKNRFSLLLIMFLLTGCFSKPVKPGQPTTSKTPIVEKTGTHVPDITSTPPPTPTVTLTATPASRFTRQCLQTEPKTINLKDVTSGTVLVFPDLLDIQSGKKHKLPALHAKPGTYGDGNVSPDGKMYAYTEDILNSQLEVINEILWVINARAEVLSKISFAGYLGIPHWLDNEHLIMDTKEYGILLIVNPFTHEQRDLSNELPLLNMVSFPAGPWWRIEYSPNLEWVAYAYRDEANRKGWDMPEGTIVRDVVTQQNLWQSTHGDEGRPAWSPDGKEVAIVDAGQLYLVNRSGQAKPVLDETRDKRVSAPAWSPDGQHITFWNFDDLFVYDTQLDQGVDVCIKSSYPTKPHPHWSPNSEQFGLDGYFESDTTSGDYHILVDLPKNAAYKIGDLPNTAYPDTWMNSLP